MEVRFRSWWQKVRRPLEVLGIIVICMLMITLLVAIILAYAFNVDVPGLRGKTLWDWLQLLIIPAVLAVGGYLFSFTTSRNERKAADRHNQTEREIAQDNQREAALQEYIDKMSELLLYEKLRESQPEDEVRNIARVRTLTVLPRLDGGRKRSVLQFLHESGLINKDTSIVGLKGADLSEASLYVADLSGASLWITALGEADLSESNLFRAKLSSANLNSADLREAFLNEANLRYADLSEADLSNANLGGADLTGAKVAEEQLKKAWSLLGATMPGGSIHP